MTAHDAAAILRSYPFVSRDWVFTADKGNLAAIRYDYPEDRLWGRVKSSLRWLFRVKKEQWEKVLGVSNLSMARYALRREKHLPDGVLDEGRIITFWAETGAYLMYVQPSVGELVADLLDAHPDLPEVQAVAAEIMRIDAKAAAQYEELT